MRIIIMGQCTLHWGRMEFGNIGNYYIMEPFVRELHKVFPNAEIITTFQMSEKFCKEEMVETVPMSYYYGWKDNDLEIAEKELEIANRYQKDRVLTDVTPYIGLIKDADLVIDFSGDIWGDNADFLGSNRFYVGLCKDRVAQIFAKKTVMLAGSPGPFKPSKNLDFARKVFESFDLVTNREAFSEDVLKQYNFNLSNCKNLSCPAFLFEPKKNIDVEKVHPQLKSERDYKIMGVILCGWNFIQGPFDKWPRKDKEYYFLADALVEFLKEHSDVKLCLFSHSNGFDPEKRPLEMIHGRDYPIIKQLQKVLEKKGMKERIFALDGIYDPWTTKAIIGSLDMLISGRAHGAVAGFSQGIPTVVIDYGHEPKAHKLKGFANEIKMLKMVAEPDKKGDIFKKLTICYNNRNEIHSELEEYLPEVLEKAKNNFKLLKELF